MLGKSVTRLVIVCDDKTVEYANYLRQLISVNDDKDGEIVGTEDGKVEAIVWLEKDYIANMATISSNSHVLFIGENKVSKNEIPSMTVKFDKFGMKYGWLGKRGMMLVSDSIKRPETYEKFIEFCLGYQKEFEKVVLKKSTFEKEAKTAATGVALVPLSGLLAFVPSAALHAVGIAGIARRMTIMIGKQKTIKDQQYRALTAIMYVDGLSEFLEG